MFRTLPVLLALLIAQTGMAASLTVPVASADGKAIGSVTFEDGPFGLLILPKLAGLPEGLHGFHIHEHPDCGNHAQNAGSHFDPGHTQSHQGPYGKGHLGDLPVLPVDAKGTASTTLLAPRLKTGDLSGHALMIHAGGDNYTDNPPLGGGGDRIACGKIA